MAGIDDISEIEETLNVETEAARGSSPSATTNGAGSSKRKRTHQTRISFLPSTSR